MKTSVAIIVLLANCLTVATARAQIQGVFERPTVVSPGQPSSQTAFGLAAGMTRKEVSKLIKGKHKGQPDGSGGYVVGAQRLPLNCPVGPDEQEVEDWSEGYVLNFSGTDKLIRVQWAVGAATFFTPYRQSEFKNIFTTCSAWISSSFGASTYDDDFTLPGWSESDSLSLPTAIFYGRYLLASYWIRPTASIEAIRLEAVHCTNINSNLCIALTFEFTGWRDYTAMKSVPALAGVDASSGLDVAALVESKYPRNLRKNDHDRKQEIQAAELDARNAAEQREDKQKRACLEALHAGDSENDVYACGSPDHTSSDPDKDQLMFTDKKGDIKVYIDRKTGKVESVQLSH